VTKCKNIFLISVPDSYKYRCISRPFVSNDIFCASRLYVKNLNIWSRDYLLNLTERLTPVLTKWSC